MLLREVVFSMFPDMEVLEWDLEDGEFDLIRDDVDLILGKVS